jgi:tetratricopeptide (TPR) repeat protein
MLTWALERVDEADVLTRARALTSLANGALLDVGDGALEQAEEAVRLALQVDDDVTRCLALTTLAWALRGRGRSDELCAAAQEAVDVGTAMGSETMLAGSTYLLGHGLAERGDIDGARETYALNGSLRTPLRGWAAASFAQAEASAQGRWDEAVELVEEAHALGTALGATNESIWTGSRLWIEEQRGRWDEAGQWLERSMETILPPGARESLLHIAGGDMEAARRAAAAWWETMETLPRLINLWSFVPMARAALALADAALAARLRPAVTGLAGTYLVSDFHIDGPAEHPIGLVALTEGRVDDAVEALGFALSAAERHGWHALVANYEVDLAAALLARDGKGDADRAAGLLRDAAEDAARLDMAPTEQQARDLLA